MSARALATPRGYGAWALVTGASDGIGRAFSVALANRGYNLVLVARRHALLQQLAEEIEAQHGVSALPLPADLSQPHDVARVLAVTGEKDIGLFVGAAGFGSSGDFIDNRVETELEMIDVNCHALAAMTHTFAKRFTHRGSGGIVLMSSIVAFQGVQRAAIYAATKAFVQSLAEGLRLELRDRGVDVIACAPGPVASGFAARARMTMDKTVRPDEVAEETLDALGRRGVVRPGRLSKLLEAAFTGMPRRGRVRIMAKVMAGMARRGGDDDEAASPKPASLAA